MKTALGSYAIYRQPKVRAPELPQFEWKWVVRFFVGTGKPLTRSKHPFPICEKCLAEPGNPVETRPNCGCQRKVRDWAGLFLKTHTAMLQRGEVDRLQDLLTPPKFTPPGEVLAVYLERGPKDRRQRVNFLRTIYEQATGKELAALEWDELNRGLIYDWVEIRQEAGRRGWLGLGAGKNMPATGWRELRELQRARKLRMDTKTSAEWNTTIFGHVVSAKSIFNGLSRENILRGLNVPPLTEFLNVKLARLLPRPKGHREIDEELMQRITAELPSLQQEQPRVYAFVMLCAWVSGRPGKVATLPGSALEVLADGTGLVTQPEAKGGNESRILVDSECVKAVLAVRTAENLFGAKHATEALHIHTAANDWLTALGMTGTKKMSMFRHHKLNLLRNTLGDEMAAAAAGHTTTAMVRSTYTRNEKVVPLVNPFAASAGSVEPMSAWQKVQAQREAKRAALVEARVALQAAQREAREQERQRIREAKEAAEIQATLEQQALEMARVEQAMAEERRRVALNEKLAKIAVLKRRLAEISRQVVPGKYTVITGGKLAARADLSVIERQEMGKRKRG